MSGPTGLAGPALDVKYRQGTIIEFDQATFENQVLVGTTVMENIPVLGLADAVAYVPGAKVGIQVVDSSWGITGRYVVPGTHDAEAAASLLSSLTRSQTVDAQQSLTTTSFTDLATVGPTVDVSVGPSGRILAIWTSKIGWSVVAASPACGGAMSVELSGANILAASDNWRAAHFSQKGGVTFDSGHGTFTEQKVFENLAPGLTTLTAKYRAFTGGVSVDFQTRTLTVIRL